MKDEVILDRTLTVKNELTGETKWKKSIKIVNCDNAIIEINGMKYTYDLFQAWADGGMELNVPMEIIKREDGVITFAKLTQGIIKDEKFYSCEVEDVELINGNIYFASVTIKGDDETSKKK